VLFDGYQRAQASIQAASHVFASVTDFGRKGHGHRSGKKASVSRIPGAWSANLKTLHSR
jgi:hypothetical protein